MRRLQLPVMLVLLMACLLSSCAPSSALNLDGTSWELVSLAGADLIPGSRITLAFAGDELNGIAGCNHYFASYSLNGAGDLHISAMGMTAMACLEPEGIMEQEVTYANTLSAAVKAVCQGSQLRLQNAAGQEILTFSAAPE